MASIKKIQGRLFYSSDDKELLPLFYDKCIHRYYYTDGVCVCYLSNEWQKAIIEMEATGAMSCKELQKPKDYSGNAIIMMYRHETEHRTTDHIPKTLVEEDTSLDKYYNYKVEEVKIADVRRSFPIKIRFVGFLINIFLKYKRKDMDMLKEYLTYL